MQRLILYGFTCALFGGVIGALSGYLVGAEVVGGNSETDLNWYVHAQRRSAIELSIGLTIIGAIIGSIIAITRALVEQKAKPSN